MEYGLIYLLTNRYFQGLVKIGMTRRLDISRRIHELSTAVPEPFVCANAYKVPLSRLSEIEGLLHDNYDDKRVGNSEFFAVDPVKVDKLMRCLGSFEPMRQEVQRQIDTEEEKRCKPRMDFYRMGLQKGQILVFERDHTITCSVSANKKVVYNGQETSLSNVTQHLLGYPAQPSPHWMTEDGTPLSQLYIASIQKSAGELAGTHKALADECHTLLNTHI